MVGAYEPVRGCTQALADLKALGLITFPRRGQLAPSEVMFL